MTSREYNAHIARREREIKSAITKAVYEAVEGLMATDADGDDKLGVKYLNRPVSDGCGTFEIKAGFKDGIGIEVNIATAYKPEVTA